MVMYSDYYLVTCKFSDDCFVYTSFGDALLRKSRMYNPSLYDIHKICINNVNVNNSKIMY